MMQKVHVANVAAGGSYIVGGYNLLIYVVPAGQSAVSGIYLVEGGTITTIKAADSRLSVTWGTEGTTFTSNFPSNVELRILSFQLQ